MNDIDRTIRYRYENMGGQFDVSESDSVEDLVRQLLNDDDVFVIRRTEFDVKSNRTNVYVSAYRGVLPEHRDYVERTLESLTKTGVRPPSWIELYV